ncbi:MAG: dienelactone hydrolase family protein [Pseudomonadota bacterium]
MQAGTLCQFLVMLTLLATSAHAQATRDVEFPSADGTLLEGYVMRPRGREGRSPAVIALHGCGGPLRRDEDRLSSRHRAWGRILANAGYYVVFPDSFGSRGYGSLCKVRPRPVRQKDRLADVEGTIRWLKTNRRVNGDRIALIGWSNGGTTALRTSVKSFGAELRQIIAFYPGCRRVLEKVSDPVRTKLQILMGAADDWTPPEPCVALAKRWQIPIVLYDGAYHGFDSPNSRTRVRDGLAFTPGNRGTAHVGTHYQARREAIAQVLQVLAVELKP